MRHARLLISLTLGVAMGLLSCAHVKPTVFYQETQYPFFALLQARPTESLWVRNPSNILAIHETVKAVGYRRVLEALAIDAEGPFIHIDVYIKKSLRELLREVVACDTRGQCTPYATAFWVRRRAQGNEQAARLVAHEAFGELFDGQAAAVRRDVVIPELESLLNILGRSPSVLQADTRKDLRVLVDLQLHESAHNVLSGERYGYPALPQPERNAWETRLLRASHPPPFVFLDDDTK